MGWKVTLIHSFPFLYVYAQKPMANEPPNSALLLEILIQKWGGEGGWQLLIIFSVAIASYLSLFCSRHTQLLR